MQAFHAIELAIDLARSRRDAALQALQQVQRGVAQARVQMQQLQQYARETQGRLVRPQGQIEAPPLLTHYDQFMDRLESTLRMQDGVLVEWDRRLAQARTLLEQAETRLAGLKRVLEARQHAQALKAQRREQKQMDEWATQLALRSAHSQEAS